MTNQNKKETIIFLATSFSTTAGGRTSSIFQRAKMFSEMGYQVLISTSNLRPNYRELFFALCKKHGVDNVGFLNMLEFYAEEPLYYDHPEIDKSRLDLGTIRQEDSVRAQYNEDGNVIRKDYFRPSTESENLVKTNYYVPSSGRCFMTRLPSMDSGTKRIVWHRKSGEDRHFLDRDDLTEYWIAQLNENYAPVIFFVEDHRHPEYVLRNRYIEKKIKTVATVHGTIFGEPYTYQSPLREYYKNLLIQAEQYSAVITLSDHAAGHIRSVYAPYHNMFVIPNPLTISGTRRGEEKKDLTQAVVCNRLEPLKRIDHSVRAFRKVVDQVPDAKLYIYGSGSQEEELRQLIEELDLKDSVLMPGFTQDPIGAVSKAAMSLFTSEHEGFPMAILESLYAGTPVIAYDFLYGPRAVIKDGVNGRIIENGNIDLLADTMISLFKNRGQLEKMCQQSNLETAIPSNAEMKERWEQVFQFVRNTPDEEEYLLVSKIAAGKLKFRSLWGKTKCEFTVQVRYDHRPEQQVSYYFCYDANRRFDLGDELFAEGEVKKTSGDTDLVRFRLAFPDEIFEQLIKECPEFRLILLTNHQCFDFRLQAGQLFERN